MTETKKYEDYFNENIESLKNELEKVSSLEKIVLDHIDKLKAYEGKGQHYLIEEIKNAIGVGSQKQSLLKDQVALKKIILDYTVKGTDKTDGEGFMKVLQGMIASQNKIKNDGEIISVDQDTENIDNIISDIVEKLDKE